MTLTVPPMLAVTAEPFDSTEHLFELKWDGVRALAATESGGWRLWGRQPVDYQPRYPELEVLRRLPAGTVVDGELVLFRQGRADLAALQGRHQLVHPRKIRYASRYKPVSYLLFDLLYWQGESLCGQPLSERRKRLEELLARYGEPELVFSQGIVGPGRAFFEQAISQGHEGVMAKQLTSSYMPGRRNAAWRKIKPRRSIPCVIIGYTQGRNGVATLLVAAPWNGTLQYVAELFSGIRDQQRKELARRLSPDVCGQPIVACPKPQKALWVEPKYFCHVRYFQRTALGRLRDASFYGLLDKPGQVEPHTMKRVCDKG